MSGRSRHLKDKIEKNLKRVSATIPKKRKSEDNVSDESLAVKLRCSTAELDMICESESLNLRTNEGSGLDCICNHIPPNVVVTATWKQRHQLTCLFPSLRKSGLTPLPLLSWADPQDVWQIMIQKDNDFIRDNQLFSRHPSLQARMRSILLDWIIEVCEVYRLHRETYYLAMDFLDRYLAANVNIPKQQLQLIGITCLFIAAKLEEIYPPKLNDFSYVTDGACTEKEILMQELIILKSLKWNLTALTVNGWLNIFMQTSNKDQIVNVHDNFFFPKYSGHIFVKVAQLLDLCMLDIGCFRFSYRVIAAAALLHLTSPEVFHSVTGLDFDEVTDCVRWLQPFVSTLNEAGATTIKFFNQISEDDMHNIQTHTTTVELLESAQEKQNQVERLSFGSPMSNTCSSFLTPPQSLEKPVESCS
ncbi:G1/S-specific cyclin-E1, variant 3 [Chamberlinius hualienensis]